MTKEKAIEVLEQEKDYTSLIESYGNGDTEWAIAYDMAIKSLKAWDKLLTEIKETANKIRSIRNDNLCFFTEQDVLEIIDKYRRDRK